MKQNYNYKILWGLCTVLACTVPLVAQAGFQFNAPVRQQAAASTADVPAMPATPDRLLPIIEEEISPVAASAAPISPVVEPQKSSPATPDRPVIEWNQPARPAAPSAPVINTAKPIESELPRPETPQASSVSGYDMAVGFGKDLPLVSALRQVIPAKYTFALSPEIKQEKTVSWTGGREWPIVLNDMLSQVGLVSVIDGNKVSIRSAEPEKSAGIAAAPSWPSVPAERLFSLDETAEKNQPAPSAMPELIAAPKVPAAPVPEQAQEQAPDTQSAADTMDRLYISQYKRRPQILTSPDYSLDEPLPVRPSAGRQESDTLSPSRRVPSPDRAVAPLAETAPAAPAAPAVPESPAAVPSDIIMQPLAADAPLSQDSDTQPISQNEATPAQKPVQIIASRQIDLPFGNPVKPAAIVSDEPVSAPVAALPAPAPVTLQPEQAHIPSTPPAPPAALSNKADKVISTPVDTTDNKPSLPIPAPAPEMPAAPSQAQLPDISSADIPDMAPAAPQSSGQWVAQNGTSLKTVLESWADLEGVDLFWSSDYDYVLAGDVSIEGSFDQAVETLLQGFADARPRPVGRLHPNLPNGPAVLVVETRQGSQ